MEVIFESLVETGWGAIILGFILIVAMIINFWKNPPKA